MKIKSVELETVCGITSKLPANVHPEVAFAGRSNAGKSSLINCLMQRKSLARTSSSPGKTQTVNYYNINSELYLVDLPGYGYAKISRETSKQWGRMIEMYLTASEQLEAVFLIVDIRHEPTAQDLQMIDYLAYLEIETVIIATKADKLKRSQLQKNISQIKKSISANTHAPSGIIILPFSSVTGQGRDDVIDLMDQIVENSHK
ncbi:MAG: YihA family ribosome biogenesis GTP-binding protein [Lachnospiraceae bacterium]|uniref:Probable GTP-binding protein EngB n=1 Tax=Candidatus Weimeria bifida TaxID=2599074 RepID=A0A6N7J227_9FIRM|nr:YihA family ribosome biogenesis GTP-binding protein [Candidatus Weimeria bifida]RRF96532.1 MAG: YihA family ribosome biogenesis GTP-binding protein [Lachnospiraceae bacterium]